MGKHLFEYADHKAYCDEIMTGRKAIEEWTVTRIAEVQDDINVIIENGIPVGWSHDVYTKLFDIELASHGQLVGLVERTYAKYLAEENRLASLVASGKITAADTPGGGD